MSLVHLKVIFKTIFSTKSSGKAFADFVRDVGWKSFIVLYETEDGLVKIQELLKLPKTFADIQIKMLQLTPGTTDYRPLLKEIKKSEETRIVLDCDYDKISLILAQANEVGLLTDYHNYLGKTFNKTLTFEIPSDAMQWEQLQN